MTYTASSAPLYYLASPYRLYPAGAEQAFIDVCAIAGHLIETGVMVYSPIAHCHPIAAHSDMDLHRYELWMPFDLLMLARCDGLIIAHMQGWEESVGIAEEVKYFMALNRPIFDLDIKTLCLRARTMIPHIDFE